MAEIKLFGIAEELLKNLGSKALNDVASAWGFKTQLKKLKNTVDTIKNDLLDAEERQADSHAVRGWLERLSTAVYAADDLFDKFTSVAAQKQLVGGNKLTKEVCNFFSHSNQVAFACKCSWNIKRIKEELDDIEKDGKKFNFLRGSPKRGSAMSRRDQTMSYVDEHKVVGRDDEKKVILDILLSSSSTKQEHGQEELPVISIVGMGGMGKTTLAQLIYNDPQVKEYFDLSLWVCVSDGFDLKVIIDKLLKSATNNETPDLELDQLQGLWWKEVVNKKYLLVLDDVWNKNREKWLKLSELLKMGKRGSKILVTTRSREVAKIMGTSPPYELQGLSEEMSWKLFEKMAFKTEEAQQKPHLVKIGKEIVKNCRHVPLALRTLGSLLYGQEESEWLSVKNSNPAKISDNQSDIMNILKYSYNYLSLPQKNCFAYCALFPKDYEIDKDRLIDLWIAEGFIPDSHKGQSLDGATEVYFNKLLQRGFFQDVNMDEWGVIRSCKMHDFMHDLAQEVAGVNFKVAKFDGMIFDDRILHLSLTYQLTSSREIPRSRLKLLRTFLLMEQIRDGSPFSKLISQEIITRYRSLLVLDLNRLGLESLPSSIGKLIHLRYLNLSETPIQYLPDSITGLWNLQTLRLEECWKLRRLPGNMKKLTNLRSLNVVGCYELSHMPSGLGGLTLLNSLPELIVYLEDDAANLSYKATAKLSDLKNLNKLRRGLSIKIKGNLENAMIEVTEADLSSKHELIALMISLPYDSNTEVRKCDEGVLEGLKPPSTIKSLRIDHYRGQNLPSWATMDNLCKFLPNLVEIILLSWKNCQQLPAFSHLPFLKRLQLAHMKNLEYIEHDICGVSSSTSSIGSMFFPCLEQLELYCMKNLKGWWTQVEEIMNQNNTSERASSELAGQTIPTTFMQFSKLSKLYIIGCPKLRWLPLCPNVEDLWLKRTSESLSVLKMARLATTSTPSSSSSSAPSSSSTGAGLKLKSLTIDNAKDLMSLPNHCLLHQLSDLEINGDNKLQSTERLGDVFANLSSSLRSLKFSTCKNLRSIAKGLEHLTNLETLQLKYCDVLDIWEDEEGMPWKAFNTSLRSLTLCGLNQLVGLPTGLQHLSNLRSLSLSFNSQLEELPEWMSCFSSLEYLQLRYCPKLRCLPEAFRQLNTLNHLEIIECKGLIARCQGPNGSDWPKIQHIPLLSVTTI